MGCDIHAAIEVSDGNGWKALRFPNKYHGKWEGEPKTTPRIAIDRNYSAFAILADVRNGVGFAACDTGDPFVPMSKERGLPKDITPLAKRKACTGDHSDTYVTADEVIAYDWTRQATRRGYVTAPVFEEWDRRKEWDVRPTEWCGDTSGRKVTNEEMRAIVGEIVGKKRGSEWEAATKLLKEQHWGTYTQIEWQEPYTRAAGQVWLEVVPLMLKLRREHKKVRLVMNFDS